MEEIFEPFSQGDSAENDKVKGTGLGLTIAKAYSELLGGNIHVESVEGEGSIFTSNILEDYFSSKELNKIDRFTAFAIVAADEAIKESGINNLYLKEPVKDLPLCP